MTREQWLNAVVDALRPDFEAAGKPLPDLIRASVGFPSKRPLANNNRSIGECWDASVSGSGHREIFVSPIVGDSLRAGDVLVHELVHAAGCKGHKGEFKRLAITLGLVGKMTHTTAGEALVERLNSIIEEIGAYPHAAMDPAKQERKKQSTRMLKLEALDCCGYIVRTTQKWIDEQGRPFCPHQVEMQLTGAGPEEEEPE